MPIFQLIDLLETGIAQIFLQHKITNIRLPNKQHARKLKLMQDHHKQDRYTSHYYPRNIFKSRDQEMKITK